MKKNVFLVMLIAIALNVSCLDKDQRNWKKAADQNTIQSYRNFINKFPQSVRVDSAQIKINMILTSLIDSSLFYIVKSTDYDAEHIRKKMDCFTKATKFLETAISNDSLNSIALNNLAVLRYILGNEKNSIELFTLAAKLEHTDSTKAVWLMISIPPPTYMQNRSILDNSQNQNILDNSKFFHFCQSQKSQNINLFDRMQLVSTKANLLIPPYGITALKQGDKNQDVYASMFEPKFDESIKGYQARHFVDMNIRTLFGTFDNPKN